MSLAAGVRRKLCCEIRLLLRLVAGEDLGVETEHRDKYDKCFGSAIRLVRFFFLLQYNTCIKLNISPFFFSSCLLSGDSGEAQLPLSIKCFVVLLGEDSLRHSLGRV